MSETLETDRVAVVGTVERVRDWSMLALSPGGLCIAMSQDVDAYYRQMAFNYKEAAGKGEDG